MFEIYRSAAEYGTDQVGEEYGTDQVGDEYGTAADLRPCRSESEETVLLLLIIIGLMINKIK